LFHAKTWPLNFKERFSFDLRLLFLKVDFSSSDFSPVRAILKKNHGRAFRKSQFPTKIFGREKSKFSNYID